MTTRKRVRTSTGNAPGGSGAAPIEAGDVDAQWDDTFDVVDEPVGTVTLQDTTEYDDLLAATQATLQDSIDHSDAYTANGSATYTNNFDTDDEPIGTALLQDSYGESDAIASGTQATVQDTEGLGDAFAPSMATLQDSVAMPESNLILDLTELRPTDDTWIDEDNPNDTHGSDNTLLVRKNLTAVHGRYDAYILWDLTQLDGWVEQDAFDAGNIRFIINNDLLVSSTLNLSWFSSTSKPFDEATASWNNPPTEDTQVGITTGFTVPSGDSTQVRAVQGDFKDDWQGKWLMVKITTQATLEDPTYTIDSKEAATEDDRPEYLITLELDT